MTKLQLLQKTTTENIYLHYLQISKFPTANISSPFSDDKKPSFKLFKNGTFKCFSTGNQGDVWQFVADLKKIDVKKDFDTVLKSIVSDMNLIISNEAAVIEKPTKSKTVKAEFAKDEHFKVETTGLTTLHYNYFKQFKITEKVLSDYQVKAVVKFQYFNNSKNQITKFPIYKDVIAICYTVNNNHEIYIPTQSEKKVTKFFYNQLQANDIFGLEQLQRKAEIANVPSVIITAGKKDCLVLNSNGFNAVCFRSENHYPTEENIKLLSQYANEIYICYDNDFTKTNNPGQKAQQKIIEKYPFIKPIYLPQNINDVAELYFKDGSINESFYKAKEAIQAVQEQKQVNDEAKQTIFHIAKRWLSAHYNFRYNTIKLEIESSQKGTAIWEPVNENDLFVTMQESGINISIDKLISILKSKFVPHYNPIAQYFNALPKWVENESKDYIAEFASFVHLKDKEQFAYHFKKWLVRAVKCATIEDYFNKQALILVSPKQNDGKTSFCRFLLPPKLKGHIGEDFTSDKDARIMLCKNLLINLDELAVLSKQEINTLKAFFTKSFINERLPYDRKNTTIPRICSFIGSTNQDEFLVDETGSVRWLCFKIDRIDWTYRQKIDINNVWAQAVALANKEAFESELNKDDLELNEKRNREFQIVSVERELINKCFYKSDNSAERIFMTSTEVMQHIIKHEVIPIKTLNQIAIGRALKQEGFVREKQGGIYGYNVSPYHTINSPKPNLKVHEALNK